jgi:dGTPase
VAVADEIAQQTHDLEDGLRAGSVELAAVERLPAARRAVAGLGDAYRGERRRWRRENMLIRSLIAMFVTDVIEASAARLERVAERHAIADHDRWLVHAGEIGQTTIWFSADVEPLFAELKAFIYRGIINHWRVNRQDWRARKVVTSLFRAFHANPLTLPDYVLLRARDELGFPYLRDRPLASLAADIASRYHPSPGFARLVTDHIAGMSDRFALEEFRSLEQPAPDQRFLEDVR